MAFDDLVEYYREIVERGWASWVHGMKDNFSPIIPPRWEKRTQKVSEDRQVTIAWDPEQFTDTLGDQNTGVSVFRNAQFSVMLFPVLVA